MAIISRSLDIYHRSRRVNRIKNPSLAFTLRCLDRLDGEYFSELLIANPHGWLDISSMGDSLSLCFCDYDLEVCRSTIVARADAAEWVERFMNEEETEALTEAMCLA